MIEPAADSRSTPSPYGRRSLVARNLTRQTVLATDVESGDGLWAMFMGLMGRQ